MISIYYLFGVNIASGVLKSQTEVHYVQYKDLTFDASRKSRFIYIIELLE